MGFTAGTFNSSQCASALGRPGWLHSTTARFFVPGLEAFPFLASLHSPETQTIPSPLEVVAGTRVGVYSATTGQTDSYEPTLLSLISARLLADSRSPSAPNQLLFVDRGTLIGAILVDRRTRIKGLQDLCFRIPLEMKKAIKSAAITLDVSQAVFVEGVLTLARQLYPTEWPQHLSYAHRRRNPSSESVKVVSFRISPENCQWLSQFGRGMQERATLLLGHALEILGSQ